MKHKTATKLTALFFIMALLVSTLTCATFAATDFSGGSGTADDPYLISTAAQLVTISTQTYNTANSPYLNYSYKLTADIDMSGVSGFNGIGCRTQTKNTESYAYKGVFDGNGHIIKNVTFKNTGSNPREYGIIAAANGATVKNLGVENISVTGGKCSGAIVGIVFNSGVTVSNCYVKDAKFAGMTSKNYAAGGIVGSVYTLSTATGGIGTLPTIENCYSLNLSATTSTYLKGLSGIFGGNYQNLALAAGGEFYANISNCYTNHDNITCLALAGGMLTNSYASATTETVTAATMGSGYIENRNNSYHGGLPILAWEYPRVYATVTPAGEHASIKNETPVKANTISAVKGQETEFEFVPDSGYTVESVKIGTDVYPVTDNKISLILNEDTTMTINTKAAAPVDPGFATSAIQFVQDIYDGNPIVFGYAKLNAFTSTDKVSDCGMYVAKNGNALKLELYQDVAPGGAFGIGVFGKAITIGDELTFTPYAGDTLGTETAVTVE